MNALPSQSRFIIGTEACERFSFYGMKSILMLYMTGHLLMSENWATSTLHIFVGMVYLLPVAGAWLADKVWGRYKTILYISLLYCVGHGGLEQGNSALRGKRRYGHAAHPENPFHFRVRHPVLVHF